MSKPTKNTKPPIFDKKGVLQLEKVLNNKDAYLNSYKPESSYLYCAISTLHKFETVYSQYKFEKDHGKIFSAYKSRMFNVGDGTFTMEATSKDDRAFTIFLLTLKSLELSISEYINSKINEDSIQVAMSRLSQQTYALGMLRGSEGLDDGLEKRVIKKASVRYGKVGGEAKRELLRLEAIRLSEAHPMLKHTDVAREIYLEVRRFADNSKPKIKRLSEKEEVRTIGKWIKSEREKGINAM